MLNMERSARDNREVINVYTVKINYMNVPLYYTLQQCDKVMVENTTMPYIKSLYSCLNRVMGDGYTDDFKLEGKGIQSIKTKKVYLPNEIKIINTFRFEGNTNPDDNAIMYIIETADGVKGTLVNSFSSGKDYKTGSLFLVESESIQ
jgi:hypothetical protein